MKQDLRLKKLLKEEIKQILLQEGLMDKAREYMGVAAVGTALGGLFGLAPEETEPHQRVSTTQVQEEHTAEELLNKLLKTSDIGVENVNELKDLERDDFISAINLLINKIKDSSEFLEDDKIKIKDYLREIVERRTGIPFAVRRNLLRQLQN